MIMRNLVYDIRGIKEAESKLETVNKKTRPIATFFGELKNWTPEQISALVSVSKDLTPEQISASFGWLESREGQNERAKEKRAREN